MKRFVLDANAVITNFEGRNGSEKVRKVVESAAEREVEISMSVINVAEVYAALWKRHGEQYARQAIRIISGSPIEVVDANLAHSLEAAEVRAKFHVGLGDAFAASTAIRKRATLITADPEFRKFEDQIKVLWLPSHKSAN